MGSDEVFLGFVLKHLQEKRPLLVWSACAAAQLPSWRKGSPYRLSVPLTLLFMSIVLYPPGLHSLEEPSSISLMISDVCLGTTVSILTHHCSRLKNSGSSKPLLTGQVFQTSNFGLILCSQSPSEACKKLTHFPYCTDSDAKMEH